MERKELDGLRVAGFDTVLVCAIAGILLILSSASVDVLAHLTLAKIRAALDAHAALFAVLALGAFVGSIVLCARRSAK